LIVRGIRQTPCVQTRQFRSFSLDLQAVDTLSHSLTDDQRRRVADALRSERSAAIHDALVILTEWIDCRGLTLHLDGEAMPVDRSGMGFMAILSVVQPTGSGQGARVSRSKPCEDSS